MCLREVTYGACCIDDFTASSLGADFLIHYGHSCLVPVDETIIPCMYVFVNIDFDVSHIVKCIRSEFDPQRKIALAGTIQFASAVQVGIKERERKGEVLALEQQVVIRRLLFASVRIHHHITLEFYHPFCCCR